MDVRTHGIREKYKKTAVRRMTSRIWTSASVSLCVFYNDEECVVAREVLCDFRVH